MTMLHLFIAAINAYCAMNVAIKTFRAWEGLTLAEKFLSVFVFYANCCVVGIYVNELMPM